MFAFRHLERSDSQRPNVSLKRKKERKRKKIQKNYRIRKRGNFLSRLTIFKEKFKNLTFVSSSYLEKPLSPEDRILLVQKTENVSQFVFKETPDTKSWNTLTQVTRGEEKKEEEEKRGEEKIREEKRKRKRRREEKEKRRVGSEENRE